jgi:DNA-binding MarR family transcriptional regulator
MRVVTEVPAEALEHHEVRGIPLGQAEREGVRDRHNPEQERSQCRATPRLLAAQRPPLTVSQLLALRAIADGPIAAADLARRAAVSGAAVSQLIGDLERDGLVERAPAPADRRRLELALTVQGRRTLSSVQRRLGTQIGDLLRGLPRPEADALARALAQVESVLAGTPPPRRPPPPHPKHPSPRRR